MDLGKFTLSEKCQRHQLRGACGSRAAGQMWLGDAPQGSRGVQVYALDDNCTLVHVDTARSRDFLAQCDEQLVCHVASGTFATLKSWRNRFGGSDGAMGPRHKWPPSLSERALSVALERQRKYTGIAASLIFQSEFSFQAVFPAVAAKLQDYKPEDTFDVSAQTGADLWHLLRDVGHDISKMHADGIVHRSIELENVYVAAGKIKLDGYATSCMAVGEGENQQMQPNFPSRKILGQGKPGAHAMQEDVIALSLVALQWGGLWPRGSASASDPNALRYLEAARVGPSLRLSPSTRLHILPYSFQQTLAHEETWCKIRALPKPLPQVFESVLRQDGKQIKTAKEMLSVLEMGASAFQEKPTSWQDGGVFRGTQRKLLDNLVAAIGSAKNGGAIPFKNNGVTQAPLCFSPARLVIRKKAVEASRTESAAVASALVGLVGLLGGALLTRLAIGFSLTVCLVGIGFASLLFYLIYSTYRKKEKLVDTVATVTLSTYPDDVTHKDGCCSL